MKLQLDRPLRLRPLQAPLPWHRINTGWISLWHLPFVFIIQSHLILRQCPIGLVTGIFVAEIRASFYVPLSYLLKLNCCFRLAENMVVFPLLYRVCWTVAGKLSELLLVFYDLILKPALECLKQKCLLMFELYQLKSAFQSAVLSLFLHVWHMFGTDLFTLSFRIRLTLNQRYMCIAAVQCGTHPCCRRNRPELLLLTSIENL